MTAASVAGRRIILAIFFVGLLAAPVLLKQPSLSRVGSETDAKSSALSRYGFFLEEVAHSAKIDFVHHAPVLVAKLAPIMPEMAPMAACSSFFDYNAAACPKLYFLVGPGEVRTRSTTIFVTGLSK